ncbi:hypothetical protein NUTIK01_27110 [Novosphingobium sp. IK01]|uniref:Uncharacterized protein n=2 Tax=Novosphingobium pituita TaxID=3056842 RepID=A0ABQ6PBV8_9SPHN|nr:hypothetical protein NUTIK01_27110 [Novosphingobium sp. IK01]
MHIRQLGSVLASHRRAVFAVESGLVGFWGEQHGDTPDKQTPSAIASVVDQWRVALAGTQIQILARYPKALQEHIAKQPDILAIQPKVGFWNDCLGAHDDVNMQVRQVPIVEGETCMLAPRIDYSCNTMMGYFQSIQLDELHSEYYRDIIAGWKMQGCFKQLEERLGYRYVIRKAKLADDGSEIMLQIDNVGWGRSLVSRPLYLVHDGHRVQQIGDLVDFYPGSVNHLHIHLNAPLPLSGGSITLETDDDVQFSNTTGNLIFHFN